jgi:hypothetical protein
MSGVDNRLDLQQVGVRGIELIKQQYGFTFLPDLSYRQ